MWFPTWLRNSKQLASPRKRPTFRPRLEALEDRWLPSTLTVTTTADSGRGSLRADIAAAKSGDTIGFNIPKSDPGYNPSTGAWTITLTGGELLIKKSLTITWPGASQLTVSGDKASRVFELSSSTKPQVTLSGLTISNGLAYDGGGILNYGTLTVSASVLSCNNTVRIAGYTNDGGGIDNYGTLTVSNSTLSDNTAITGGGISNHTNSTLTVTNSTLSNNSTAADGEGGAIDNYGTLTVNGGSILSNNQAGEGGGGILNAGTLTLANSSLLNNIAAEGGGIDTVGSATVSGCTLSGNSAIQSNYGIGVGGGIYVGGGTATLTNDKMNSNPATVSGGGLYIGGRATVSLDAFTVANILNNTDSSGLNGPTANIDGSYTLL